jgi:fatty-acid desaturase
VSFHLGVLAALFYFRWSALVVFVVIWILAQNVGIGMGYHRLLTHRGYSTPKWLEYSITTCGTLALQGGPIYWVAVHRMHHRYTDKVYGNDSVSCGARHNTESLPHPKYSSTSHSCTRAL